MPTPSKTRTTAFVEDLTSQGFALLQKGQEAVTTAARAFAGDVSGPPLPKVPASPADLKKTVDDGFHLVGRLLDSQRSLAHQVIDTLGALAWPGGKAPDAQRGPASHPSGPSSD